MLKFTIKVEAMLNFTIKLMILVYVDLCWYFSDCSINKICFKDGFTLFFYMLANLFKEISKYLCKYLWYADTAEGLK